jgi:hypothetical protein
MNQFEGISGLHTGGSVAIAPENISIVLHHDERRLKLERTQKPFNREVAGYLALFAIHPNGYSC